MKRETKRPLYKVLNEEKVKGNLILADGEDGEIKLWAERGTTNANNLNRLLAIFVNNDHTKANAQYTALCVNNLHHLAEALEFIFDSLEHGSIYQKKALEALKHIS